MKKYLSAAHFMMQRGSAFAKCIGEAYMHANPMETRQLEIGFPELFHHYWKKQREIE